MSEENAVPKKKRRVHLKILENTLEILRYLQNAADSENTIFRADMSKDLGLSNNEINPLLSKLAKDGYIILERSTVHKKNKIVKITAQGIEAISELTNAVDEKSLYSDAYIKRVIITMLQSDNSNHFVKQNDVFNEVVGTKTDIDERKIKNKIWEAILSLENDSMILVFPRTKGKCQISKGNQYEEKAQSYLTEQKPKHKVPRGNDEYLIGFQVKKQKILMSEMSNQEKQENLSELYKKMGKLQVAMMFQQPYEGQSR